MSGESIFHQLLTTKRKRITLGGSFVTANTSAPTSQVGDGVAARTGTGTFTVTLPKKYGSKIAVVATLDNAADDDKIQCRGSYNASTGVITCIVRDISGAAAADSTGLSINWIGIFSQASS